MEKIETVPNDSFEYHGEQSDGRCRIKRNGRKMLARGRVYEIVEKTMPDKTVKTVRHLLWCSPNYIRGTKGEKSFIATCPQSGKKYRIIGLLEEFTTKMQNIGDATPEIMQPEAETHERLVDTAIKNVVSSIVETYPATAPTENCVSIPNHSIVDSCKKTKALENKKRKIEAFKVELKSIRAQLDVGLDPRVSINALEHMSNRSRASIYRDFENGKLGEKEKNGRRSFVLYSVAESYMRGI